MVENLTLTPPEIAWLINDSDGNILIKYPALNQRFDRDSKATALAIILAESGGNADKQANGAYGLAQIKLSKTKLAGLGITDPIALTSPQVNIRVMAVVSVSGNSFQAWSSYRNGTYKKHLQTAKDAFAKPVNPEKKIKDHENAQTQAEWEEKGPAEQLMAWIGAGVYRVGLFVGGGVLIIGAIVLSAKKGIK